MTRLAAKVAAASIGRVAFIRPNRTDVIPDADNDARRTQQDQSEPIRTRTVPLKRPPRDSDNASPRQIKIGVVKLSSETVDLYTLSNLAPESTGLPIVVWIAANTDGRRDVRVWVSAGPGVGRSGLVSVAIKPTVRVVAGRMSHGDLALLRNWIELSRDVIIQHWNGEIESSWDAIQAIKPLA